MTRTGLSIAPPTRYALGLGLLWSWGNILHHSPVMLVDAAASGELNQVWLFLIGVGILCFAAAALFHRK